jgi:uncharacterized integral membrane protein
MSWRYLFVLIAVGTVVVFVIQNIAVVEVQFLFWSISVTRSLLLLIIFGVGILLGWLLKSYAMMQKKKTRT